MKKTRLAAKLFAGVAVAAALVLGSAGATTTAQAKDLGWFSVTSGQTITAGHVVQSNSDLGWF